MLRKLHRLLTALVTRRLRRPARRPTPTGPQGLTAVEYEAVALIAYEGRNAHRRAREQARYCRDRGSERGYRFWSEVANEVRIRTRGDAAEPR